MKDLDFVQVFAANAVTDPRATPWWMHRDVLGEITGEKGYRPVGFAKIDDTWATLRFRKPESE